MEDTQEVEEVQEQVISDKTSENKEEEETRDEILARHRYSMSLHRLLNLTTMWATEVLRFIWFLWFSCNAYLSTMTCIFRKEISQLQKKEVEMKKQAARGSKAEQKAKKKQVEEEVSQLSAKLKEKQAKELSVLGYSSGNGNEKSNLDNLVKAIAGVSVSSQPENTKVSKAKQRRDKRAQQEAEREQRIQAEQNDIVSDRMVENEKLEKKLKPLGLTVCEIKPDGHCLYRAVENQLAHLFGGKSPYTYQQLREMAAAYMRKHTSDFLPFCLSENLIEGDSDESIAQKFENYCKEVESTAIWGGQLELGALTHCLKKHIMIFSGSFPDVEMGKEYKSADGIGSSGSSIMLSYHMHAFGLGEHYNSVVSIPT